MGISSHLPTSQFSLEGEVTSWAKETIQKYDARAAELTSRVKSLEDQALTLHSFLDSVRERLLTQGQVNLSEPEFSSCIEKLKEGGIDIPVPQDGLLTQERASDWMKIVDDVLERIQKHAQQLQSRIPEALLHLKETLQMIQKILGLIHEIIMLIIRNIGSHGQ